ncbi:uncharacterized protein VTP21DRAFT_6176 [Calcarisporiella thermophila]|uniref:uncharacterized protein n=1 Tax=Calcarisporiella thermophila TaxID=911321 RepID=UPI0037428294
MNILAFNILNIAFLFVLVFTSIHPTLGQEDVVFVTITVTATSTTSRSPSPTVSPRCSTLAVRKEFRQLSNQERNEFLSALRAVNSATRPNRLDSMSYYHLQATRNAHGQAQFFPWHRLFLREFERALQTINPRVTLPYWYWGEDADNPAYSQIFSNQWYGGTGTCINTGQIAYWNVLYNRDGSARLHCLPRQFNRGNFISPWASTEVLQNILLTRNTFDEFRTALEGSPHGNVHITIGGDMGTMASPNDPIFFMHHCFLDKLWMDWQNRGPQFESQFNGVNKDGSQASITEVLYPYRVQVQSMMSTQNPGLCYTYSDYIPQLSKRANLTSTKIKCAKPNTPSPPTPRRKILPVPQPLPDAWLEMNGLNASRVRQEERRMAKFISRYNYNVTANLPLRLDDTVPLLE